MFAYNLKIKWRGRISPLYLNLLIDLWKEREGNVDILCVVFRPVFSSSILDSLDKLVVEWESSLANNKEINAKPPKFVKNLFGNLITPFNDLLLVDQNFVDEIKLTRSHSLRIDVFVHSLVEYRWCRRIMYFHLRNHSGNKCWPLCKNVQTLRQVLVE